MDRPIVGYHLDAEGHWVAELACGHYQHVRHQPPWINRPWVVTPEGRLAALCKSLECKKCDAGLPPAGEPINRCRPGALPACPFAAATPAIRLRRWRE